MPDSVSKLFRAYGLYNSYQQDVYEENIKFQSSFELTGYITSNLNTKNLDLGGFKALSSLRVI